MLGICYYGLIINSKGSLCFPVRPLNQAKRNTVHYIFTYIQQDDTLEFQATCLNRSILRWMPTFDFLSKYNIIVFIIVGITYSVYQ